MRMSTIISDNDSKPAICVFNVLLSDMVSVTLQVIVVAPCEVPLNQSLQLYV